MTAVPAGRQKVPFCKTGRFRKSYFNRIVYLWNSLPQNIRREVTLESFMKDTDQILHVYLNNHFQETPLCWSMFLCCFCSNCGLLLNWVATFYNVLSHIFTRYCFIRWMATRKDITNTYLAILLDTVDAFCTLYYYQKPEFTVVIFIHYNAVIAVAIFNLQWMKMIKWAANG